MKSKLLKVLAVTLAVALGSTAAFAAAVPADVQGRDCEKAVTKLVEENIITGDTDGLYHPDKNLTRAEVSTLIAKAVDPNAAESKAAANYSDMAGYGWAAPFIGLMTEKQIAKGYPDGTFKPGANVKVSELAAFVIRACGINDGDLEGTWPDNYMKKADEMDLFDAVEGKDQTSMLDPNVPATKEQAAIAVYNALDQIRGEEPVSSDWIFGKVSVSKDHKTLNDMELAENVKIYSYGKAKDYSETMELPDVKKLEVQHPLKYAGASTNGFYKTANGKVTEAILPADQGATGRAYGLVTGYYWTVNASGTQVFGVETMIAGEEIEWTCTPDIKDDSLFGQMTRANLDGQVVEFTVTKGQVKAISAESANFIVKPYTELSAKGAGTANPPWAPVVEKHKTKPLLKLDYVMDPYMAYADNVLVYVMNDEGTGFEVGSVNSIRKGDLVRCYDVTDDKEDEANIIFVKDAPEDDHN